jgi:tetratricopeptide (TPR) repeat protein
VIALLDTDSADAVMASMLREVVVSQLQEATQLRVVKEADREAVARGFVVRGGLLRSGNVLSATVQLEDQETGVTLASTHLEGTASDSLAALGEMAQSLAQFVRRTVGSALDRKRLVEAHVPERAVTMVELGRQDMALGASLWGDRSAEPAVAAYRKADSMFAVAASLAGGWDLPWMSRAETAYRLMWIERLAGSGGPPAQRALVNRGLDYANEAVRRADDQAESLELRALLYEWAWLLSQPDSTGDSAEFLAWAEEDARRATELNPQRAGAWNVLGAILLHRGEWADAYWALGRAVAADTHLKHDTEILSRLFTAAWESGNDSGAQAWCDLLGERAGPGWPATACELYLMAGTSTPDLERVEELREQARSWAYWSAVAPQFDALAAVLHARAGESGRAREILAGLPASQADSELPYLEAWVLLELGEKEEALILLESHVATAPLLNASLLLSRRFRGLLGSE